LLSKDDGPSPSEPLLPNRNEDNYNEIYTFDSNENDDRSESQYISLKLKRNVENTTNESLHIVRDEKVLEMLSNDDSLSVSNSETAAVQFYPPESNVAQRKKEEATRKKARQRTARKYQIFPNVKAYRPYFTISVSLLQIVIFAIELVYNNGVTSGWWINVNQTTLINLGAKVTPLIQQGEWWRLITATYLHAGILHLLFNIFSQLVIGVQTERFIGWWRIAFIYFCSGVGGCLASAIFLPRALEVGASSAIYGLLGIFFVDLAVNWALHDRKKTKIVQITTATALSLAVGLLPYIDNFAHIGGLITGIFASLVIVPRQYLLSHNYEYIARRRTIRRAIIGGVLLVAYFGGGLYLLYNHVDVEAACRWCEYLSCLPVFEYCIEFHNNNNNKPSSLSRTQPSSSLPMSSLSWIVVVLFILPK